MIAWMTSRTMVALALAGVTALAIGLGAVALYRTGYAKGAAEVQQQWDAEKAATAAAQAEETMKARQREKALIELTERLRKEHRREVDRIVAERNRLVGELRNRPEARAGAGGVPEGAAAGVGCTGEGLSRRDGEFLAGLAADAARTQAALQQCVAQYNQVRELVNGGD